MSALFVAWFMAIALGIAFSGAIACLWQAYADERPHFGLLAEGGILAPVKGLVFVATAPTNLIFAGAEEFGQGPAEATLYMLAGITLSLFEGVTILTWLANVL
jgi:hypothetical protein